MLAVGGGVAVCVGAGGVAGIAPRRLGAPRPTHDGAAPCARPRRYLSLFSRRGCEKNVTSCACFPFHFSAGRTDGRRPAFAPSAPREARAPSRLGRRGRENGGDRDGEACVRPRGAWRRMGGARHAARGGGGRARAAHQHGHVVGTCGVPALRLTRVALSGGDVAATSDLSFRAVGHFLRESADGPALASNLPH